MWELCILCFIATVTLMRACSYTWRVGLSRFAMVKSRLSLVRIGWSVLVGIIGIVLLQRWVG